jgi:hypothetical protein
MSWRSIPPSIPHWLRRYPLGLTTAIAFVNRAERLFTARRGRAVAVAMGLAFLAGLLAALLATTGRAAFIVQQALSYGGILVAASGLYGASLISTRRRKLELVRARSWLIATPRVAGASSATTALLTIVPLVWRLAVFVAFTSLLSLNAAVTIEQSLRLGALTTVGAVFGALCGWALSRPSATRRREGSRYTPRPKRNPAPMAPSGAALSHWPIAQAFAWGRPENARLLLGAAVLTVPAGSGLLGALFILVTWIVGSYLVALLIAIPRVAQSASEWLRSTPISFWEFAWPLARRALLHQLCGATIGSSVLLMLGSGLSTAVYFGTLWMILVVLTAVISLADCYRARSPGVKTTLSLLTVLLAEGRAQGWGLSLALLLTALHLRLGARHVRA